MKFKWTNLLFSLIGGLLLTISVHPFGFYLFVFVAFIPFYSIAVDNKDLTKMTSASIAFFTYFIWHLCALFWLIETYPGMYFSVAVSNSLCFSIPFYFYPIIKRYWNVGVQSIYFIASILIGEWLSQVSQITSPFCNMGLILGQNADLMQHYRWIGVEGSALWILAINISIYWFVKHLKNGTVRNAIQSATFLVVFLSLPFFAWIGVNSDNLGSVRKNFKVAILATNLNHYSEFALKNPEKMVDSLIGMSKDAFTSKVDLLVWPEVIVNPIGWVHQLDSELGILNIKKKLVDHPETKVAFGAVSFSLSTGSDSYSAHDPKQGYSYNTHNVSVLVGADSKTLIKSKEKFIPVQERIPYLNTLPFLKNLSVNNGINARFSEYNQDFNEPYYANGLSFQAVLCFESLFPLFMMSKTEADVIVVHASEFWMKNTIGALQYHFATCPIAVQTGRPILRSTNAGFTSVIMPDGKTKTRHGIPSKTGCLITTIHATNEPTFYQSIAGGFYGFSGIYVLLAIVLSLSKTQKNEN